MSYDVKYALARPCSQSIYNRTPPIVDRMSAVSTLNRIAIVVCERLMLLMNNTELVKHRRMTCMDDVLLFLGGNHDDVGLYGDRGDFYRRKLAEEIYTAFAVHGVTHENVMSVVMGAIKLERDTRLIIEQGGLERGVAPPVSIDDTVLDILARIANMN
ncbi:uncharacterized protein LOC121374965 [Gigantopelta aegis]|uniref:uncharacterized protein LOC121374965 n=1 Tax=Gigantopelta aegis TaxID=1735272 RepID=UPI001B889E51|nr:uncharacterized protein LOC121374965 [Gigantopelta aegis]